MFSQTQTQTQTQTDTDTDKVTDTVTDTHLFSKSVLKREDCVFRNEPGQ